MTMTEKISSADRNGGRTTTDNRRGDAGTFDKLYGGAVDSLLEIPIRSSFVETTAGNPERPPVVVFQGGNITTPVTLAWFQALADEYYLIAPDTPGQPGKSTSEEPARYSNWVREILDGLGIDRAAMIGSSHGAGILLETATQIPERITKAALVVPAGLNTTPSLDISQTLSPTFFYQMMPQRWLLRQALAPIFTEQPKNVDPIVIDTIGWVLRNQTLTTTFPGPTDLSELSGFDAPTVVVAGEEDPFFPGNQVRRRATQALPSLVDCLTLPDERHFLSPAGQIHTTQRIRKLFAN